MEGHRDKVPVPVSLSSVVCIRFNLQGSITKGHILGKIISDIGHVVAIKKRYSAIPALTC